MAKEKYLECGQIVGTHGVRGTVRLESYCDTPETLAKLRTMYIKNKDGSFSPYKVKAASVQKSMVLCSYDKITTLEDAIPYKWTTVYADRDDLKLKKGDHFIADMIGLDVLDYETNEKYGILKEVLTPGPQNIYVVEEADGRTFMIPCVSEFIRRVETEKEPCGIFVKLIAGMRNEAEAEEIRSDAEESKKTEK